jgi:hypothetical protein
MRASSVGGSSDCHFPSERSGALSPHQICRCAATKRNRAKRPRIGRRRGVRRRSAPIKALNCNRSYLRLICNCKSQMTLGIWLASSCDSRATQCLTPAFGTRQKKVGHKKDDPPGGDVRAGLGDDAGWMRSRIEAGPRMSEASSARRGNARKKQRLGSNPCISGADLCGLHSARLDGGISRPVRRLCVKFW